MCKPCNTAGSAPEQQCFRSFLLVILLHRPFAYASLLLCCLSHALGRTRLSQRQIFSDLWYSRRLLFAEQHRLTQICYSAEERLSLLYMNITAAFILGAQVKALRCIGGKPVNSRTLSLRREGRYYTQAVLIRPHSERATPIYACTEGVSALMCRRFVIGSTPFASQAVLGSCVCISANRGQ